MIPKLYEEKNRLSEKQAKQEEEKYGAEQVIIKAAANFHNRLHVGERTRYIATTQLPT